MFGRRGNSSSGAQTSRPGGAPGLQDLPAQSETPVEEIEKETPAPAAAEAEKPKAAAPAPASAPAPEAKPSTPAPRKKNNEYYETKAQIFNALVEAIDLSQLARLDAEDARDEIRDVVNDIIALKNVVMSIAEQEDLLEDICNDVLGYGPLEPLLARDDIADIMVNGAHTVYIETQGKVEQTGVVFRDNAQLMNICQRIVSQVGRRVDDASPICDARCPTALVST